jgi:hypothetical protein
MKIPIGLLLCLTILYLALICSLQSLDHKLDRVIKQLDRIEAKTA